jgi:hypothetical protein
MNQISLSKFQKMTKIYQKSTPTSKSSLMTPISETNKIHPSLQPLFM